MLRLLLLLVATQVPAVPGETSLVSFCKQGRLSACDLLKQTNPQKAAEILRDLEALKVAEEAREQQSAEGTEEEAEAAPEPPDCKGQNHHVISRLIAKALKEHKTLGGLFKPRDRRFVAKAKDEDSHCGYQEWHRKVDQEVIDWIEEHPDATQEQFMRFLREIYKRPKMLERFPNGF
jgi:hypothetical protein